MAIDSRRISGFIARMDAQLLTNSIPEDVTGWWASEKYDGVRAIWTGSKLQTRHGKTINAPSWFTSAMPKGIRLDGELWIGRGKFNELQAVMQSKDGVWSGVKYMVFDLADVGNFEERNAKLQGIPLPFHVYRVEHTRLSTIADLDETERKIVSAGGEGVVIRRPGCLYRPGRCGDVIKVKRLIADIDRWQG